MPKTNPELPHKTDASNAEIFAKRHKDQVRYDHRRKRWLLWKVHWWAEDTMGQVIQLAKLSARYRLEASARITDDDERKEQVQWAFQSESRHRIEAMLALAKSEHPLADAGKGWDSDPWLFAAANGVVDLRTGQLRQGQPSDRITLHTTVDYDPAAKCPRWEMFLHEVFEADVELIDFIHRAVGYSLSGSTVEQCLFFCHGGGSNGKSTLFETLRFVLGDYAYNLPFSAFEIKARSSISNDIAALPGRRFVTAIETSETVFLNEARIKALTGGDTITARFLYKELFQFEPVSKFWLAFNHRPRVADDSLGYWRRIVLLPFQHVFKEGEQDKALLPTLKSEAAGILAWAVRGCLAWQERGLERPAVVKAATEEYRSESDPLADFIAEKCVIHPKAIVLVADLWLEYQDWSKESGGHASLDRKAFNARLETCGISKKKLDHGTKRGWLGICRKIDAVAEGIPTEADMRTVADSNSRSFPLRDVI